MSVGQKKASVLERDIATLMTQVNSGEPVNDDVQQDLIELQMELDEERKKEARQKEENVRRRHNYVPMIVELLKALSQKGALGGLVDTAVEARRHGNTGGK